MKVILSTGHEKTKIIKSESEIPGAYLRVAETEHIVWFARGAENYAMGKGGMMLQLLNEREQDRLRAYTERLVEYKNVEALTDAERQDLIDILVKRQVGEELAAILGKFLVDTQ